MLIPLLLGLVENGCILEQWGVQWGVQLGVQWGTW